MSLRSDRARRRATKRRNQRILFGAAIVLVIGAIAFLAYTALTGNPSAPADNDGTPTTTNSGLIIEDLTIGTGAEAQAGNSVTVHYTGWLEDGTKFDSSLDSGQPFTFQLGAGSVIQGWDEGVAGMKVGGKRRLTIPPDLGYGAGGYPPVIPANATLIFEVELLGVQ